MLKLLLGLLLPLAMGIRVIGHGGGEAEAAALAQIDRLPLILEPCLQASNPCHLDEAESGWLRRTIADHRLAGRHTEVSFFSHVQGNGTFRYYSDWIFGIRSEDLYEAGRPKPVSEIARIVFLGTLGQARFSEMNVGISLEKVSRKLFGRWSLDSQTVPLTNLAATVRVLNFRLADRPHFALVQFDAGKIIEITSRLAAALPCPDLISVGPLTEEDDHLLGPIVWRCDAVTYSGLLQMRIKSADPLSLDVRVRNRGVAEDCASDLRGR